MVFIRRLIVTIWKWINFMFWLSLSISLLSRRQDFFWIFPETSSIFMDRGWWCHGWKERPQLHVCTVWYCKDKGHPLTCQCWHRGDTEVQLYTFSVSALEGEGAGGWSGWLQKASPPSMFEPWTIHLLQVTIYPVRHCGSVVGHISYKWRMKF